MTNAMWYPELYKNYSNVNGDIIMHKLPKDGAVKGAWINLILKGTDQSSYFCNSLPAWLINYSKHSV